MTRSAAGRCPVVAAVVAVATIVFLAGPGTAGGSPPARSGAATHSVVLTVDFSASRRQTFTIGFDEPSLSGLEVLRRTGLSVNTWGTGLGTAVCRIGDVGRNPGPECLGRGSDPYWAYFHDGEYSRVGAGASRVTGGTEQWRWGTGSNPPPPPSTTTTTMTTTSAPRDPPPSTASPPTTTTASTGPAGGGAAGGGNGGTGGPLGGGGVPPTSGSLAPSRPPPSGSSPPGPDPAASTTTEPGAAGVGPGADRNGEGAGRVEERSRDVTSGPGGAEQAGPAATNGAGSTDGNSGPVPALSLAGFLAVIAGLGAWLVRARRANVEPVPVDSGPDQ